MSQNHYQVLGVATTASAREIKLAYKRLAVQYHPDKHGGNTLYEELFKAVAAAYHVLGDPGRRAQYDYQLQAAARRLEEQRRQQQFRHQGQRVYGVPMPPPAPLRTRRPAGAHERHYRPIPRQRVKFTRRDLHIGLAILLTLVALGLALKFGLDHLAATRNYHDGLRAYTRREWSAAHSFFAAVLAQRPTHGPALQRQAEIEDLAYQNPEAAVVHYRAALTNTAAAPERARLLVRLGHCYQRLARPDLARRTMREALQLDSTQVPAHLFQGEGHLFGRRYAAALRALNAGLRHASAAPGYLQARLLLYRGLAHFKQRDYRAARADYWQVLATYPNQGQVYFLLGRVAQEENNTPEACEFFRRAVVQGYQFAEQVRAQACPPAAPNSAPEPVSAPR